MPLPAPRAPFPALNRRCPEGQGPEALQVPRSGHHLYDRPSPVTRHERLASWWSVPGEALRGWPVRRRRGGPPGFGLALGLPLLVVEQQTPGLCSSVAMETWGRAKRVPVFSDS